MRFILHLFAILTKNIMKIIKIGEMMQVYKLLYVEDEIETRQNIIKYIQQYYNFTIIEANDGSEGWIKYKKHKPEILITDLSMENLCGLELIEKIREVDNKIKIIVITAHSEQERLLRAIRLNLIEYYIKPISRKALKESLSLAIHKLEIEEKNYTINFNEHSYYNINTDELRVNDNIVKLTQSEIKLINFLIENKNKALESVTIYNEIWDFDKEYKPESVRTLIKKLRKKLPENTIENIYGGLYKLNE